VKILIFHVGQLGDTVVALPALWAIRDHFPRAHITLLSDRHAGKPYVVSADLLRGGGVCDAFEFFPVGGSPLASLLRPARLLGCLAKLRAQRFDVLVYLAPSARRPEQIARDRRFFAAAGIQTFIGMDDFPAPFHHTPGQPLRAVGHEADQLLARLRSDGIPVPAPGEGCLGLGLGEAEEHEVQHWLNQLPSDGQRPWIGVGPGSKMPAKRWPVERFQTVVAELLDQFDAWPVVFGGPEDRDVGDQLVRAWGRGYNAAGALGLRAAAAALRRSELFLGNDTGTMHLAAAAGVRCVAIFSARDWPGKWDPYGSGHRVFRAAVDCEGCFLVACAERQNECLTRITTHEVAAACSEILQLRRQSACAQSAA